MSFITLLSCLSLTFFRFIAAIIYALFSTFIKSKADALPRYLNLSCTRLISGDVQFSSKHEEETRFPTLAVWKEIVSSAGNINYFIPLNVALLSKFSKAVLQQCDHSILLFAWGLNFIQTYNILLFIFHLLLYWQTCQPLVYTLHNSWACRLLLEHTDSSSCGFKGTCEIDWDEIHQHLKNFKVELDII